jgi:hypothetical protein
MTIEMSNFEWFVQGALSKPPLPGIKRPIMFLAKTPR